MAPRYCTQVYDKAEEIANHIESTRLSHPSVSTVRAPANAAPTTTSIPPSNRTRLNVGDNVYMIDPTTRRARKALSLQLFALPLAICQISKQWKKFLSLIKNLLEYFRRGIVKLPPHRPYDIAIELLPDAKPRHGPIYSLGPREDVELRETIEKQLKAGLIRPSKSPMASPYYFMTKKNAYPLPLPQNLIEKLQGAKIFSKFDLRAGYNLVRIKEGDKWKTAFKTKYGLFEYLVMPFGDLLDVYVIIYLDNILVFSLNEKDHEIHVREVLKRLQDNDLFCNIEKCHFHVKKIDYLGFIISEFGIEVDQSKSRMP
ncbi:Retrotransposable element Tf2 protein [Rhizoctonia solani]|uniref:Retrotransposable element Tf2 protein n=1 Tax=Rhizoctonia solani TaxID=456999 RepID=A0A8H8T063_9AGAM|nr:Retrotransposable element Tf2 protein [Rhizoctonia solani]QRW24359.1 Retrotransposable element Tf2 protein [Rhizoctonia solani]